MRWLKSQPFFIGIALLSVFFLVLVTLFPLAEYCKPDPSEEATISANQAGEHAAAGADNSPFVKVVKAILEAVKSQQNAGERQQQHKDWWHSFACEMKITDFSIALFTFWLVIIGAWQGYHLKRTVDLGREEFIASHRPKIAVRNVSVPFEGDDPSGNVCAPAQIKYTIVNTGDTAARILRRNVSVVTVPIEGGPNNATTRLPGGSDYNVLFNKDSGRVLEIGERHTWTHEINLGHDQWQALRIQDLNTRKENAYIIGFVSYADLNGRAFLTAFCRQYDPMTERSTTVDDPDYEYQD